MFKQIFLFELKLWLKKPSTYIFFLVFFAISFFFTAAAAGLLGSASESNAIINSAFSITSVLNEINTDIITVIILITIIAPAVFKDFQYNMHPMLFTKPISKFGYLYGRFVATFLIALFVFSGAVFAHMFTCILPGIEAEKLGVFQLKNYLQPVLYFIIPNTLLIGAIFFSLVTFSRNMLAAYVGSIVLMILKGISPILLGDIDNEKIAAMLDPFGAQALSNVTKYWSVDEQNTLSIPFNGLILYNRIAWIGFALIVFMLTFVRFKFSQFNNPIEFFLWKKKKESASIPSSPILYISDIPKASQFFSNKFSWTQTLFLAKFEFLKIVKSIFFIIIIILCILVLFLVAPVFAQMYGTPTYPVTYQVLDIANIIYMVFSPLLIVFYSGILVWRERDTKVDELIGASPVASWVGFTSKLFALIYMQVLLLLVIMITGIFIQLYDGFYTIDLGLYIKDLFGFRLLQLIYFSVIGMAFQVIFNQKFTGYIITALVILVFPILGRLLNWNDDLYYYGSGGKDLPYSDMNGYGHVIYPYLLYKIYWLGIAIILVVLSIVYWVRGKERGFKNRFKIAKPLFNTKSKVAFVFGVLLFFGMGTFIFYNTHVLVKNISSDEQKNIQAEFEKKYKKCETTPQPRIVAVNWNVDMFPMERGAKMKGYYILKNKTRKIIDSVIINFNPEVKYEFELSVASKIILEDKENGFFIYKLSAPLAIGDSLKFNMSIEMYPKGFETTSIHYNGTFFNSMGLPSIGYNSESELSDNDDRKEYSLAKKERMAKVNDMGARMNTYISRDADWIDFECIVSTTKGQTAMAPGYLQKDWEEGGRNYFHYKMDCKILNFYSFLSADYQILRDKWINPSNPSQPVSIEIYYQKGHEYNIERMIKGVKKSLDYYTKNFSLYQHRQLRILEFPRYQMFAQSFPNTIPFSEGIGFIAKVDENDATSIDFPFYITAHEVAHQWWAHQVIGGNVQGSTLMSETMSQYSALMVMEKEYGKQAMKKFLKYEMDKYLMGRALEGKKEKALMYVENQQYIHYNKGSIIMYALKDYIGEDSLNAALAKYIKKVAYQEPPYTNSIEFVDFLRAATPDSLKYIISDMFETITLYENKTSMCSYTKMPNGKYKVKISVESKKMKSDSIGKMKDVAIADWIDIGVFGSKDVKGVKTETELYLQKRKINKNKMDFEIIVNEEPVKVGVDPYNKLIDRTPANNTKSLKGGNKNEDTEVPEGAVTITIGG